GQGGALRSALHGGKGLRGLRGLRGPRVRGQRPPFAPADAEHLMEEAPSFEGLGDARVMHADIILRSLTWNSAGPRGEWGFLERSLPLPPAAGRRPRRGNRPRWLRRQPGRGRRQARPAIAHGPRLPRGRPGGRVPDKGPRLPGGGGDGAG